MGENLSEEEAKNLKAFASRVPELIEFLDERRSWKTVRKGILNGCIAIAALGAAMATLATAATWFFEFMSNRGK